MKTLSLDTTEEAQKVQVVLWRQMTPSRKLDVTSAAVKAGLGLRQPKDDWMDPFSVAAEVTEVFRANNIEYFIGGSIASTIHGEPRFTQDIDLVTRLHPKHIPILQGALGDRFYLSEPALKEAIQRKSCANLIHLATSFKIDLMVSREREFERERFLRKQAFERDGEHFWVATAEDTILVKLEWYRMGGEVSERQLRDVHAVLLTQESLDQAYLRKWSRKLDIDDLLSKVLSEHS